MTEVGNQYKSQTLGDLTASSIETVGGRVYPDPHAQADVNAQQTVVSAWRTVHAPTYGAPVPGTGNVQSLTASEANTFEDVIVPTGNQVTSVQFIGLFNSSATTPATVDVALTDSDGTAYVASTLNVDPLSFANAFQLGNGPLTIDANVKLQFRVPTGPYANISIRTFAINLVN